MIVEATDEAAAQKFIENQAAVSKVPYEDGSYEGVEFKVGGKNGNAIGVTDGFLLVAEDEATFKAALDASNGDALADESNFTDAIAEATEGSLADVYVDIGGLIEQSGDQIDPQARQLLEGAGIDPSEATAVASVVPASDQVEVEISSDLGGEEAPPSGDVSELLGSMPGDAFAAVAASGFGDQLQEAIDELDKSGIPGEVPPNKLKSTLKAMGIDLDKIAVSLEQAAAFAEGSEEGNLGGALVLTTDGSGEAKETVANIGTLLRNFGAKGVTAVTGKASGFSIRSEDLGHYPLVIVAKGDRIAIGYGLAQTLRGIDADGATLGEDPSYEAAVSALGGTPISAYVDGPGALTLAEALVPRDDADFWEATRYLKKIEYVVLGSETGGDRATAKLIAGVKSG
jgi:hypothetical protein